MIDQTPCIPLKKILFVDEPFAEGSSNRAQRSKFIYQVLAAHFDADLLLLKSSIYMEKPVPTHSGYDKLYSLSLDSQKQLLPESYHKLAKGQVERFINILDSKRYELVVFAGLPCLAMARAASKVLPNCTIVVDIEQHMLPLLESAWQSNKKPENALALWKLIRQKTWDRFMFNPKHFYLFANPSDARNLARIYRLTNDNTLFLPLPVQSIDAQAVDIDVPSNKFILFWGSGDNPENLDCARHIVSNIYPRISKKLVEKNISIVLCGGDAPQVLSGGRIIYHPISDLPALLSAALFVLLPLQSADGENRILKTAQHQKALISSIQAVENWLLPQDCCYAENGTEAMANRIMEVLRAPKLLDTISENLHGFVSEAYSSEGLGKQLLTKIDSWMGL